jgi:ketosteroid isomerase-like protein
VQDHPGDGLPEHPSTGARTLPANRTASSAEAAEGTAELVMVGVRTPGVDAPHGRRGDDRAYSVFTVREERIAALRDCRDRQEALHLTGIQS